MNILVTGGNGYIAKNLYEGLKDKHNVTAISRDDFDLTDRILTDKFFEGKYFDVVLHTAISGGSRLRKDTEDVLDENLIMYYNLLANESKFKKFISIGSGAEIFAQEEPYGLSKHVINYSMKNKTNFHNVRIFAVFDENELETRFIKSSILKYLNNQPIEIHQDKLMDFFYMKDLITLMEYCISADDLPKEINCSYKSIYHLKDIANIINRMDDHNVPIRVVNKKIGTNYTGNFTNLGIDYIGIEEGIENVFNELKERNDKAN
jgi:nucleoside-diphosphate-sugar epimerase